MRPLIVAALALVLTITSTITSTRALASDFGFARVRATDGRFYGAVTFRPFASRAGAVIPLLVLVDAGDHSQPWLRAKQVAQLLPKVVELVLAGQALKVGADADGRPGLFVGPAGRPITRGDLEVISVLPGDVRRFRAERGEARRLSAGEVAAYWKLLLEDLVTVFVRFPLLRDAALADQLGLAATRSGVLFKRMLVEVGVLLRYEDLTLERASAAQVKAKTLEVLDALTPEQWAQLADLAFRVPAELKLDPALHALTTTAEDDEVAAPAPEAVRLYTEPDRTVWPGTGERPPDDDALQALGQASTRGMGADDAGSARGREPHKRTRRDGDD